MIRALSLDRLYSLGFCLSDLGVHLTPLSATPQETTNSMRTGTKYASHGNPQTVPPAPAWPQGSLAKLRGRGRQRESRECPEPGEGAWAWAGGTEAGPASSSLQITLALPWDPSPRRTQPGGQWPQQATSQAPVDERIL